MGKRPVIKRPGNQAAALDAFVSGNASAGDNTQSLEGEQVHSSAPVQPHTLEGDKVQGASSEQLGDYTGVRRPRKADRWGMPGPGEPIAKLGIDLTAEVRRQFKAKAATEGRDGADLIREWIRRYLAGEMS